MSGFLRTNRSHVYFGAGAVMLLLMVVLSFYSASDALTAASTPQSVTTQFQNLPTLDYENQIKAPKSKERKAKGAHFNGRGTPNGARITELPDGVEPLPITGAWWAGLSPLPIEQSDAVVLGIVSGSEAHLSDDNTGIYSEYSFVVSEILKDSSKTIIPGQLTVNRLGGAVRFKSGKVQRYEIAGQGAPQIGAQYVLFLRKTADGDFLILTGYELSNGRVKPLDGEGENDPRKALPFSKYRNVEQLSFLKELRAVAHTKSA